MRWCDEHEPDLRRVREYRAATPAAPRPTRDEPAWRERYAALARDIDEAAFDRAAAAEDDPIDEHAAAMLWDIARRMERELSNAPGEHAAAPVPVAPPEDRSEPRPCPPDSTEEGWYWGEDVNGEWTPRYYPEDEPQRWGPAIPWPEVDDDGDVIISARGTPTRGAAPAKCTVCGKPRRMLGSDVAPAVGSNWCDPTCKGWAAGPERGTEGGALRALYNRVARARPGVVTQAGGGMRPEVQVSFAHLDDAHAFVDMLVAMNAVFADDDTRRGAPAAAREPSEVELRRLRERDDARDQIDALRTALGLGVGEGLDLQCIAACVRAIGIHGTCAEALATTEARIAELEAKLAGRP
jgi:hypothetical protein